MKPAEIVEEQKRIRIKWEDEHESVYSFEDLRQNCPCAHCSDARKTTGYVPTMIKNGVALKDILPVGNYAIQLVWNDGHMSGIYSFSLLRDLCGCTICKGGAPKHD